MSSKNKQLEPWKNLEPGEPVSGPAVSFAAWFVGLLLTGAVGIGIVFIIAGADGTVTLGAHAMAFAALATGSTVVSGLLQSSYKDWKARAMRLSLLGIMLPAVVLVYLTVKEPALLTIPGAFIGTLTGIFGVGPVVKSLRRD